MIVDMKNIDTPIGPKLAKTPVAGKMIMPSVKIKGLDIKIKKEKKYPEKGKGNLGPKLFKCRLKGH